MLNRGATVQKATDANGNSGWVVTFEGKEFSELVLWSKRFEAVKWTELFESEAELVKFALLVETNTPRARYTRGIEFFEGVQKHAARGKELSEKQITQLKRLALQIYKSFLPTGECGVTRRPLF